LSLFCLFIIAEKRENFFRRQTLNSLDFFHIEFGRIFCMDTLNEEYVKIKELAEAFYKNIDSVFCPFFDRKIKFNNKGLNHIKMKSWNRARPFSDQYLRLKFIKLVPKILTNSGTLQEFKEIFSFERLKTNGIWGTKQKNTKYYGFIAILNGVRIKIIVKQTSSDSIFFWSIIPFWKHKKDEISGKIKKVFHEGDLESQ
jgi:hypothetical protein